MELINWMCCTAIYKEFTFSPDHLEQKSSEITINKKILFFADLYLVKAKQSNVQTARAGSSNASGMVSRTLFFNRH
jgi:hypothetical protein